jgi:hypothetical protein
MKKLAILLACLAFASPCYALLAGRGYRSVGDLLKAHNLLIVEVDTSQPVELLYNCDQVRTYPVVCRMVLNGKIAEADDVLAVDSEYPLLDGQRYLLAGGRATRNGKPWPVFMDKNSAVRLPEALKISSLEGRDKRSQVRMIVDGRIRELDVMTKGLEEERGRLRGLLGATTAKPRQPARPDK